MLNNCTIIISNYLCNSLFDGVEICLRRQSERAPEPMSSARRMTANEIAEADSARGEKEREGKEGRRYMTSRQVAQLEDAWIFDEHEEGI
jgi:hypothetical protein